MSDPELATRYLGLDLRTPVVASASPLTRDLDALRRLEAAGVGAVVLPSLFEEQVEAEALSLDRLLWTGRDSFSEASSFFPELPGYETAPDRALDLVERAKGAVGVPVIASLNGTSLGGWVHYAAHLESAGADALELNTYRVAADPRRTGGEVEAETLDLVAAVCAEVSIPVAVKLAPYWSGLAHLAVELVRAGAAGLVLFNRFAQPDLDLDSLAPEPHLTLSSSAELRLPLRWIGLLREHVRGSLAASSGVHTWQDVAKALLVGADVAMTTSALLLHGAEHVADLLDGLVTWMGEQDYASVAQLTGSAAAHTGPDPEGFERAGYARTLASWG